MVILAGDTAKFAEWREFAKKVGLVVVAEIFSDYHGTQDVVPQLGEDNIWRGSVHHLERGEQVAERPTVQALAQILVELATLQE